MIAKNTVLILGAGASRPYLFPTGAELRNLILQRNENPVLLRSMGFTREGYTYQGSTYLESDENIFRRYHQWIDNHMATHERVSYKIREFQDRFAASQFYSIDTFIAANPDYKVLGSLMIASILLKCEQETRLDGDWYQLLFNELVAEGRDFPDDDLSVVTFNYDRSLEMFFLKAFTNAFALDPKQAWLMLCRIKIVHVYGDLGPLPPSGDREAVSYGSLGCTGQASERIQLMSPRAADEKAAQIRFLLERASRVVFLGFGFDSMNLDVAGVRPSNIPTYASCFNLARSAMKRLEERIRAESAAKNVYIYEPIVRWGERNQMVGDFLHNSDALA